MFISFENVMTGRSLKRFMWLRSRGKIMRTMRRAAVRGPKDVLVGAACVSLCAMAAAAQPSAGAKDEPEFARPELAALDLFVGAWSVRESHFDTQGNTIGSVTGTEEISWFLDRHAIRRNYTTYTDATVYRAIGTLGWNELDKRYEGDWYDNVYFRGPTRVTATWNGETKTMIHEIEVRAADGSTTKYKRVEQFVDAERRVATTYEIKGDTVIKRMVVNYKRTIPCPPGVFQIFDESVKRRGG